MDDCKDKQVKINSIYCNEKLAKFKDKWCIHNFGYDAPVLSLQKKNGWKQTKGHLQFTSCYTLKRNMYKDIGTILKNIKHALFEFPTSDTAYQQ